MENGLEDNLPAHVGCCGFVMIVNFYCVTQSFSATLLDRVFASITLVIALFGLPCTIKIKI